ncbi:NirD/YgiW/YdeI family stress tolerance protein [Oceanisphaera sp. IT1-181]|uniref:YgiW/YdeI family stress tolerance OB fold protein n=1 Tax=Oceanisphaera sp. IT1-181 TaxID=3081199 RepID=UPI0029CA1E99|nr:NirD/YgiW/YdeI family stress tolerance protein [Oceanisphaera sp. IT1-181]
MNKTLLSATLGLTLLAGTAVAGSNFSYDQPQVSVAQALRMNDDHDIRLTGYVVEQVGKEKYLFQDGTGTIVVEIDEDKWRNMRASSRTRLTIWGQLEEEDHGNELEVDHLELAR